MSSMGVGYNAAAPSSWLQRRHEAARPGVRDSVRGWSIQIEHPNDLGHRIIANRVFDVLAQNCSALSQKAVEPRKTFDGGEMNRR